MAFNFFGLLKGIQIQNETDRTKQLTIESSSAATTDTTLTITAAQTDDRTLTLPDVTDTLVARTTTDVLTNKTIDGDTNTVQDLALTSLKTNLADASKFLVRDASGIVVSNTKAVPVGDVVGTSDSQILTNKTIDADANTISNIENADIKAGANIAVNKLAALTASRAVVTDGSGVLTPATTTSTEIGYVNGVTSSIQTQLNSKVAKADYTAKGDILVGSAASTPTVLPVGANGTVPVADSGETTGIRWGTVLANPMTTGGDIIYGGASGTPTRLPNGTSGQLLTSSGGTSAPTWAQPTLPTITLKTSGSGTYTPPANVRWLRVRMVGGGGGGGEGGTSSPATGTSGGNTTFGALTAGGGGGGSGSTSQTPGTAGTASGGNILNITGGRGGYAFGFTGSTPGSGIGGTSVLGEGALSRVTNAAGINGQAHGSGGSGGGAAATSIGGAGGGGGGYVEHIYTTVAGSYSYSVGSGGPGGTGGAGQDGGAGAGGLIIIEEYYI